MKKYFLTAALVAATAAFSAEAFAADMPVKAAAPAAAYDPWTGCYLGGNAGWARFNVDTTFPGVADFGSSSGDGWSYGGQAGCDVRLQNWVAGVRGMWDGTDASSDKALGLPNIGNFGDERQSTRLKWFSTLDARIGVLVSPTLMIYGVGGWAWSNLHTSFLSPGSGGDKWRADETWPGYNLGVGGSWMLAPNWELWVEYDHLQFGNRAIIAQGVGTQVGVPELITQKPRVDAVLVGLNYRFSFTH